MASSIDATKPVSGSATTASVRSNFSAAKSEIEALQALAPSLTTDNAVIRWDNTGGKYAEATGVTINDSNILNAAGLSVGGVQITATPAELNKLDGVTATTAELNKLDGLTATTAELNVLDGIPAGLTATELGYVDGVTSAIQTQLDAKAASSHTHATGDITSGTFADARIAQSNVTQHQAALAIAASQLTGTLADARVAQTNVTQHEAALSIATSQLTGTLADARVAESNVTQHEAALSIAWSQLTGTKNADQVDGKSVSVVSQATYDGLTPDANTLYFIT